MDDQVILSIFLRFWIAVMMSYRLGCPQPLIFVLLRTPCRFQHVPASRAKCASHPHTGLRAHALCFCGRASRLLLRKLCSWCVLSTCAAARPA
ncbi:hypothetical protein JOL62DRAFT_581316 [Phyllosticta paracitricarpa]|uniref:Secreted protein n=1 Tax=Phyllosticta paracitricarpa TaxID=2016321 RepID=A0ABR1MZK1_9PEZI